MLHRNSHGRRSDTQASTNQTRWCSREEGPFSRLQEVVSNEGLRAATSGLQAQPRVSSRTATSTQAIQAQWRREKDVWGQQRRPSPAFAPSARLPQAS
jgi:hypothetical protein